MAPALVGSMPGTDTFDFHSLYVMGDVLRHEFLVKTVKMRNTAFSFYLKGFLASSVFISSFLGNSHE